MRAELEMLYRRALESSARAYLGVGGTELPAGERAGRWLIAPARTRESGYRQLMRALELSGNSAEAVRVYGQLRTVLQEELGLSPSAETLSVRRALLQKQQARAT